MKRWQQLLPWIILAVYWPLQFVATHIPRPPQLRIYGHDVTLHILAYMILTLLYWLARYGKEGPGFRRFKIYGVVILMAVYGAADELTQRLVGRHGDFYDWLSNMGGCLIALGALYFLRRVRHWLIVYWAAMFVITHWPGEGPFVMLPSGWQQFEVLFVMASYLALTCLWWRSVCPEPRFLLNKDLLLITLYVMPGYALLDQAVSMAMGRGFGWGDFFSGLGGIIVGVVCSATLAQHHIADSVPGQNDSRAQGRRRQE